MARRSTVRASFRSDGGPKTPGPLSCIAPKPIRLTGLPPRDVVVFILTRSSCSLQRREFESTVAIVVTRQELRACPLRRGVDEHDEATERVTPEPQCPQLSPPSRLSQIRAGRTRLRPTRLRGLTIRNGC